MKLRRTDPRIPQSGFMFEPVMKEKEGSGDHMRFAPTFAPYLFVHVPGYIPSCDRVSLCARLVRGDEFMDVHVCHAARLPIRSRNKKEPSIISNKGGMYNASSKEGHKNRKKN